jgi:hypothetical protein
MCWRSRSCSASRSRLRAFASHTLLGLVVQGTHVPHVSFRPFWQPAHFQNLFGRTVGSEHPASQVPFPNAFSEWTPPTSPFLCEVLGPYAPWFPHMPFALRTRIPLLPAALAFVPFGFVLARVRVRVRARASFFVGGLCVWSVASVQATGVGSLVSAPRPQCTRRGAVSLVAAPRPQFHGRAREWSRVAGQDWATGCAPAHLMEVGSHIHRKRVLVRVRVRVRVQRAAEVSKGPQCGLWLHEHNAPPGAQLFLDVCEK